MLSVLLGPCVVGPYRRSAMTDFIVMAKSSSYMFITGPDVIKTVTHDEVSKEDLGGAQTHNARSGVAHFAAEDEAGARREMRDVLSLHTSNKLQEAAHVPTPNPPDHPDADLGPQQ